MITIRAAIARSGQPFTIEDCELDDPRADEVLLAIEACGICHTDLSARDHHYGTPLPAVLGHEGVGRIVALGPGVDRLAVGDRVVASFGACGRCPACSDGMPPYCRHGAEYNRHARRLDGSSPISRAGRPLTGHFFGQSSFATMAIASATNLVRLDDDLPAPLMAPLACGVQTGMGAVINVLRPAPGDTLLICGCGTVGLAAVMAARIAGCVRIVAVDLRRERLELAQELGATHVVDTTHEDLAPALKRIGSVNHALDNTGHPVVIEAAFAALRPRGCLVLAGLSPPGAALRIDPARVLLGGRTLRGTLEGDADPRSFIPTMIDWYRRGDLPLARLVRTYPFGQINDAAADMLAGRVIKPVLQMP